MKTPYRVGLTGGIGSGKSTVAGMFAAKGVPVIDADELARKAIVPGSEALNKIIALFGQGVISETGELRRDKLREIIFNDENKRKQLEKIIHPIVYRMMEEAIKLIDYPYCILSVPLLLETGGGFQVDEILVIDTPEELQISRTCKRDNVSRDSVIKIIHAQIDNKKRLEQACEIIKNDGDLASLKQQVDKLDNKYLKLTGNKHSIASVE